MFRRSSRKVVSSDRVSQREIMKDSQVLEFKDLDAIAYISTNYLYPILQLFVGKTVKPKIHNSYKSMEKLELALEQQIENIRKNIEYKKELAQQKKEIAKELKLNLIPGAVVRCSFSYNMTFNKFYKVLSNKNNTYKLEVLNTEWVDGDIGWTGNVKAGSETGEFIEGKLTASGFKIDNLYGGVINSNKTFYENRMD